jgi:hypothetical protein
MWYYRVWHKQDQGIYRPCWRRIKPIFYAQLPIKFKHKPQSWFGCGLFWERASVAIALELFDEQTWHTLINSCNPSATAIGASSILLPFRPRTWLADQGKLTKQDCQRGLFISIATLFLPISVDLETMLISHMQILWYTLPQSGVRIGQKNNSKIKELNFWDIIFLQKYIYIWWRREFLKIFLFSKFTFPILINYLVNKCQPCPETMIMGSNLVVYP